MVDFCVYFLYRAALALITALPLRVVFAMGQALGFCAWILLPSYRELARRNVEIALGAEKSEAEKRRIVRRHFQQLGANLLSGMKLNAMPLEQVAALVATEGADEVHRQLRAGRPIVVVLSHLGNWELFAQIVPHYFAYIRLSTVYQKLGNRYLDQFVRQQRARFGVELFDRSEGFQEAIRLLRGGGMIGILSDQHAGDHGLWTPFFGRLASTSPLPALLCKRTGATLIVASLYTDGPGKWRMTFSSPFGSPNESVPVLTAQTNAAIAEQIRRAPEDWFWVHNRWKTPWPNWLLQKYKRGLFVPESEKELQPFRILVRGSNWLGDSVVSMPAVRAIKRGRPDAHVTVLAPAKIAAIWRLLPEVDEVLSLGKKSLWRARGLIRSRPRFDVGIVFPNSFRAASEFWLAGVPRRVGYAGHRRRWLLNQIVRRRERKGPPPHEVEDYLDIARSLGVEAEAGEIAVPNTRSNGAGKIIGLCPGAEYGPAKRWLPERFAAVAAATGGEWVLLGTQKDAAVGTEIAHALGEQCRNLIGQTTLEQLIEELRKCRLLLTNDTGTMHLATLLGVPVVAVFGSTEPSLTGPLGRGHGVVRHQVECSPCFLRECPLDFRCMKEVGVEEVAAHVAAALRNSALGGDSGR
ncbi:MAG: lipopolysaccharide heptosyltransferase II [Chthoniobacterales bacterium]